MLVSYVCIIIIIILDFCNTKIVNIHNTRKFHVERSFRSWEREGKWFHNSEVRIAIFSFYSEKQGFSPSFFPIFFSLILENYIVSAGSLSEIGSLKRYHQPQGTSNSPKEGLTRLPLPFDFPVTQIHQITDIFLGFANHSKTFFY